MIALPLGIWALSGMREARLPAQSQRKSKIKLGAATLTHARFLVRVFVHALGLLLAASATVQICLLGRWSGGSMDQSHSASTLRPSVESDARRRMLSSFDQLVSDEFRPAKRQWRAEQFYQGLPVGRFRPTGQFYVRPPQAQQTRSKSHVMTIVTATRNPTEHFFTRTVRFVLEQSLQSFRWVVVNDHSTEASSIMRLADLKRWAEHREPHRILILDIPSSTNQGNGPAAMNYALRFVGHSPFVAILDDDDMWELTSLEKAALVMSWVPDAYAVSFDVVNHGDKEFMWRRGFYNGDESFFNENNLMQGSPFRSSVLRKCRFREQMADGGADWDFWMCMASHGMWGLHLPEIGNWYQWNPPDFRKRRWKAVTTSKAVGETRDRIQRRYPHLLGEDAWPPMVLPPSWVKGESMTIENDHVPFENTVGLKGALVRERRNDTEKVANQGVLLVLQDLGDREASARAFQITREVTDAGWRVTVVLTHYTDPDASMSRRHQQLLQYTHDVFVAATIAPLENMPGLIAYLLESRGIGIVMVLSETSSSHGIQQRLVTAAATLIGFRSATTTGNDRHRPIPIAVIDAGPMNAGFKCAVEIGGDNGSIAKNLNPRVAVWFAGMQPLDESVQDARTKQCLIGRGFAKVLVLRRGAASTTRKRYAAILEEARSAAAARSMFVRDDLDRAFKMEAWSAYINHLLGMGHNGTGNRGLNMRQIQHALQYRKHRSGFGRELQIACPERMYDNSRWIDGLEAPLTCGEDDVSAPSVVLNISALRASAVKQCGAWCLVNFDVRRASGVLGWEFSGTCVRQFPSMDVSPNCRDAITRLTSEDLGV
jgi:hypothetical protein